MSVIPFLKIVKVLTRDFFVVVLMILCNDCAAIHIIYMGGPCLAGARAKCIKTGIKCLRKTDIKCLRNHFSLVNSISHKNMIPCAVHLITISNFKILYYKVWNHKGILDALVCKPGKKGIPGEMTKSQSNQHWAIIGVIKRK